VTPRRTNVLLVSTYELGHQPFGIASPAAWLRQRGFDVGTLDLAVDRLDETAVRAADMIAFYVPMHTATRIAIGALERVKPLNPSAHLCFYGLYAPMNESYLRGLGVDTILGGEFEESLVSVASRVQRGDGSADQEESVVSVGRQRFLVPDRSGLPSLNRYAQLDVGGERRIAGYTEATRGCKHLCRHCPIVPVYKGRFRVVQREIVLDDIRRQAAAGASHITFGDPDFFNGPAHGIAIVRELHDEFPDLTYDVTIKIEHLRQQRELLSVLRDTGCLFVTSAVEAVDDATLQGLDKGHTRADFVAVVADFRAIGLVLNPTFVAFSPWTTLTSYADLLALIASLELIENVSPIQYAIRLLIPAGSRLLELPSIHQVIGPFDERALFFPWTHPDPRVDELHHAVLDRVQSATASGDDRRQVFAAVWELTQRLMAASSGEAPAPMPKVGAAMSAPVPQLTEPWYCCAEPTEEQLARPDRVSAV
jgi:radical SAM superfamily enzyme YgiQ (UPF0313 family)